MGRSGHRYITAWIAKNLPGKVTVYRNCTRGWEDGLMLSAIGKVKINQEICVENVGKGNHEIRTIEELPLSKLGEISNLKSFKESKLILVVRSPINWLASSIRGGGHLDRNLEELYNKAGSKVLYPHSRVSAYKSYFFALLFDEYAPPYYIYYDNFVSHEKYRGKVKKDLGLKNIVSDVGCDKRLTPGSVLGFSSFSDTKGYCNRIDFMKPAQVKRINRIMDKGMKAIDTKYFGRHV